MASQSQPLSRALEDYLETIYLLAHERGYARVKDIASERDVRAASVSPALKRLAELGLVDYERREYVALTDEGTEQARRVLSRHQVLRRFFEEVLLMPAEAAEGEACAMEHSLSDAGMDRFVRFFEFLSACPQGEGSLVEAFHDCALAHPDATCHRACGRALAHEDGVPATQRSIADLSPGEQARITQVHARGAIRRRLLDMGFLPETRVEVERAAPGGDPIWLALDGYQVALRRAEAAKVLVDAALA